MSHNKIGLLIYLTMKEKWVKSNFLLNEQYSNNSKIDSKYLSNLSYSLFFLYFNVVN